MPWVGLRCVTVVLADHTHFIFCLQLNKSQAQLIRKFTHCQGRLSCDSVVVGLLFNVLPLLVGVLCLSLFCYALLCVHFSFEIILKRKRKLVALILLSYRCIVTIKLILTVPWVCL